MTPISKDPYLCPNCSVQVVEVEPEFYNCPRCYGCYSQGYLQDYIMHISGTISDTFTCHICKQEKPILKNGGTGYASNDDRTEKTCYQCCAEVDKEFMIKEGKITLYLTYDPTTIKTYSLGNGTVSNQPGTLTFPCAITKGYHNIAGWVYNVWFIGPDEYEWFGRQVGDNTQICHCRRTKRKVK